MLEIGTSGLMSGEGKLGVAVWPKLPRLSSTLPGRAGISPSAAPETGSAKIFMHGRSQSSRVLALENWSAAG